MRSPPPGRSGRSLHTALPFPRKPARARVPTPPFPRLPPPPWAACAAARATAAIHHAEADLRTGQVAQDGQGSVPLSSQAEDAVDDLLVFGKRAVREVQAEHIDAAVDHRAEHLRRTRSRANGSNRFGLDHAGILAARRSIGKGA